MPFWALAKAKNFIRKRKMAQKLLIEIGVEELPAIPLLKELPNIKPKWQAVLDEYSLQSEFELFYTPRRLVLLHENFPQHQADSVIELIGAPKDIAYKDGKLTNAGKSFILKAGISESELKFKLIKGKEVLYHQQKCAGRRSSELLGEMIEKWLKNLNFGKTMRWGSGKFEFIRAIRSLVCVLGDESVNFEAYGVKSAMKSFVHRSISYEPLEFKGISEYFELLEKNFVILDQNKRRAKIETEFKGIEAKFGVQIAEDAALLDEVVAITEYPKALLGGFEGEFLGIPSEVIILSMRENQRYFSVFSGGKLANHFVVVANAVCEDYAQIIAGNERVLRARLSDAAFFWQNDLKMGLCADKLDGVLYLEGLGSMKDKSEREKKAARVLCELYKCDFSEVSKAIHYAKADLLSSMVYEFPELQGIMGSYYARAQGFSEEIALALREQYLPKAENDPLPSTKFSSIVALANKLDTLLGLFSLNKVPSGTKDPYALRRAASGLIKIALNLGVCFDLRQILAALAPNYKKFELQALENFIFERLYTLYDANASFIKAVLASQSANLLHIDKSIKALITLSKKGDFGEKFSTFKRLANIAVSEAGRVNEAKFEQGEEKALYEAFKSVDLHAEPAVLLEALFALKPQIDAFFDKVMINVADEGLKNNRQALVYGIYKAFLSVADIKELSL